MNRAWRRRWPTVPYATAVICCGVGCAMPKPSTATAPNVPYPVYFGPVTRVGGVPEPEVTAPDNAAPVDVDEKVEQSSEHIQNNVTGAIASENLQETEGKLSFAMQKAAADKYPNEKDLHLRVRSVTTKAWYTMLFFGYANFGKQVRLRADVVKQPQASPERPK
jgi:hypothetical protein